MPKKMEITATVTVDGEKESATVGITVGNTIEEDVQMFGEEVVKSSAEARYVLSIQSKIGSLLRQGKTADEIVAISKKEKWAPGVVRRKEFDAKAKISKMSEDQKALLLDALKAELG